MSLALLPWALWKLPERKSAGAGSGAAADMPLLWSARGRSLHLKLRAAGWKRELKKRYLEAEKARSCAGRDEQRVRSLLGSAAGGQYLRQLEKETGKSIFIRGSDTIHLGKFNILLSGTPEKIQALYLPCQGMRYLSS